MKRQLGPMLAVLGLICAPLAWSQTGAQDSSSSTSPTVYSSNDPYFQITQSGSSDQSQQGVSTDPFMTGSSQAGSSDDGSSDDSQSGTGPQATFNHPEQLPPLSAITDVTRNTGVAFSLGTGSLSDYVWGGKGQPHYWQNIGMWNAGLMFSQIRDTSMVMLGYTGGVSLSSISYGPYGNYTTLNQNASARILWNFAQHWQMRIKDNYLYTDNPFEPFLTYTSDPTPNNPNPTVYFPQAVVEQNVGSVDISYRVTSHDSVTVAGNESFQHYIRGVTGLWNSYSWGGGAYYQHVFSPKFSAGTGYNFNALDFGHGQSRAGVQMIEGFVAYKFNPGLTVTGWIGPEYTATKNLIPIFCTPYGCLIEEQHKHQWDVAEGGTVSYFHSGNSLRVQFSHRVTNGGGVLGAISLYQATLAYSRPINRVWGFAAAIMYDNSNSVTHQYFTQYWNAAQGTIDFSRKFGESWNGSVYLLFINQTQNFYGTPGTTNTAGLGLTLRYVWGHLLGR